MNKDLRDALDSLNKLYEATNYKNKLTEDSAGSLVSDVRDAYLENPYLIRAINAFRSYPNAEGVIISCVTPKGIDDPVCKPYATDRERNKIVKDLQKKFGTLDGQLKIAELQSKGEVDHYANKIKSKADAEKKAKEEEQEERKKEFKAKLLDAYKRNIPNYEDLYNEYPEEVSKFWKLNMPKELPEEFWPEQAKLINKAVAFLKELRLKGADIKISGAKESSVKDNTNKIVNAFEKAGLPTDDLVVTTRDSNNKIVKRVASPKLATLRKELFGESLAEALVEEFNGFDTVTLYYPELVVSYDSGKHTGDGYWEPIEPIFKETTVEYEYDVFADLAADIVLDEMSDEDYDKLLAEHNDDEDEVYSYMIDNLQDLIDEGDPHTACLLDYFEEDAREAWEEQNGGSYYDDNAWDYN